MNDIDSLIERLQEWAENEPDLTGYGGKVLKETITALQEMQEELENEQAKGIHSCGPHCQRPLCVAKQRIAELENKNAGLRQWIEDQEKARSKQFRKQEQRIEELEWQIKGLKGDHSHE